MTKIYTKNTWVDEILAGAERYSILENGGAPFKSNMQILLSTSVLQAASPFSATRMNNLENGLDTLDTKVSNMESQTVGTPTLLGTWANYGGGYQTAGYYKDGLNIIHLQGLIKSGASGSNIFQLPAGYRPTYRRMFVSLGNNAISRIDVQADGTVTHMFGDTAFVTLEGISFPLV